MHHCIMENITNKDVKYTNIAILLINRYDLLCDIRSSYNKLLMTNLKDLSFYSSASRD